MSTLSAVAANTAGTVLIQPVANWVSIEGKEISVFQENDQLNYSITTGSHIETGTIFLSLYDTPELKKIALLFITIFKRVLIGNGSTEHCFLPIFWTIHERPSPAQDALIALFARVRPASISGDKEVVEAHWGVYEASRGSWLEGSWLGIRKPDRLSWLEVGKADTQTRDFLKAAPAYRDRMDIYGQHFKEVVTLGPDSRVQSIVLRCVSALDDAVFLDENSWAITLISFQSGEEGLIPGHAEIAWEGIEAGRYFLRCADLTAVYPLQPGQPRPPGTARLRIVDREIPSKQWRVGPTHSRTKALTNRMVERLSIGLPHGACTGWSSIIVPFHPLAPLSPLASPLSPLASSLFAQLPLDMQKFVAQSTPLPFQENCLSFAVSHLRYAGIFLPGTPCVPNPYIDALWVKYTSTVEGARIVYKKVGFFTTNRNIEVMLKNKFQPRDSKRFALRDGNTLVTSLLPAQTITTVFRGV